MRPTFLRTAETTLKEGNMTYRVTSHTALVSNLAAANTAVMLCRANIERIQMTNEQRNNITWKVCLQIRELEGILTHLKKTDRSEYNPEAAENDNIVHFFRF